MSFRVRFCVVTAAIGLGVCGGGITGHNIAAAIYGAWAIFVSILFGIHFYHEDK